ncbi:MAG: bacteriochlorophyll 4-vinyl reductase [Ideonella sp.]|jgi:divinyl protochlorophyllide a 8-vinyl-reductase|nr:bacteriochlorophyll 4-vinyl reductase [Ideonella sp.]
MTTSATASAVAPASRIGPNAITRVDEALREVGGAGLAQGVFERAGLAHHLRSPPSQMVDEQDVIRLHHALRALLGPGEVERVARDAGERTAAYLLAHRIPRPVQALLRHLPAPLASRVLLRAIGAHAWTFAGSGRFEVRPGGWRAASRGGRPVLLVLHDNPTCRGIHTEGPACAYHAAVFERLFTTLVHPRARVAETACASVGADACRFEVRW